jgi:20S proteasome alpha/beta subunit
VQEDRPRYRIVAPQRDDKMTICIAAICEKGKNIVVAADRMFTVGPPLNVEFEPQISKIEELSAGCVALPAGPTLYADELLKRVRAELQTGRGMSVKQICELVPQKYAQFRDEKCEEIQIEPLLGRDFRSFREKGGFLPAYLQAQPGIYQNIVVQQQQYNLGLELMIAGIDVQGCHIGTVTHPGTLYFFDKLGYNAVGSGAVHAGFDLVCCL